MGVRVCGCECVDVGECVDVSVGVGWEWVGGSVWVCECVGVGVCGWECVGVWVSELWCWK